MESENENEESKWDSKIDDYDEESRKYYQEYRVNYGDPQIKQRFRRVTRWREHRAERLDRRMGIENTTPWQKLTKRFMRFQKDLWYWTLKLLHILSRWGIKHFKYTYINYSTQQTCNNNNFNYN